MNKIKFTWNNTDWSVSNSEIIANSSNAMKTLNKEQNPHTRYIHAAPKPAASTRRVEDEPTDLVERARRQATALAWSTDYPFLVLPCLTEELEQHAREYLEKQEQIREQTAQLFPRTFPLTARQIAA